jgi:hypothetical protein
MTPLTKYSVWRENWQGGKGEPRADWKVCEAAGDDVSCGRPESKTGSVLGNDQSHLVSRREKRVLFDGGVSAVTVSPIEFVGTAEKGRWVGWTMEGACRCLNDR